MGESEAGIDSFSVAGLAEHPEHPRTRGQDTQKWGVCVCVLGRSHHPHLQEHQNSEKESEFTKVTQLMNGCKVQESHGPFCSPEGLFLGL